MIDDVHVVNRRLDATGNEALIGLARMGADAFGRDALPALPAGDLAWISVAQMRELDLLCSSVG